MRSLIVINKYLDFAAQDHHTLGETGERRSIKRALGDVKNKINQACEAERSREGELKVLVPGGPEPSLRRPVVSDYRPTQELKELSAMKSAIDGDLVTADLRDVVSAQELLNS